MNRRDTLAAMLGLPMVVASVGYAGAEARRANAAPSVGLAKERGDCPHVSINVRGPGQLSRADIERLVHDLQAVNPGLRVEL